MYRCIYTMCLNPRIIKNNRTDFTAGLHHNELVVPCCECVECQRQRRSDIGFRSIWESAKYFGTTKHPLGGTAIMRENIYILLYSIVGDRLEMQLYLLGCVPTNQLQGCLEDASLCEMLCVPTNNRLNQLQNNQRKQGVRALPPIFFDCVENELGTAAQSRDKWVRKAFRGLRPTCGLLLCCRWVRTFCSRNILYNHVFYALTQNFVYLTHFFVKL